MITLPKTTDKARCGCFPVFLSAPLTRVRKMLQMAAGPGGTGQKRQTVGYSVGGKSGHGPQAGGQELRR